MIESGDLGDPFLGIHRHTPRLLEFLLAGGIFHGLEARIVIRQSATVSSTLNVVLSSQRIDPCRLLAKVSGDQRQVAKALNVTHATDVFGDSQGVVDARTLGFGIFDGTLTDQLSRNARNLFGVLQSEGLKMRLQLLYALNPLFDVFLILEAFVDDDLGHGIEEGHVRTELQGQVAIGVFRQRNLPGIHHVELGSFTYRFFHTHCNDGVALGHIRAHTQHHLCIFDLRDRVRHGSASNGSRQTGDGRTVSATRTVVDLVRIHDRPGELLQHV